MKRILAFIILWTVMLALSSCGEITDPAAAAVGYLVKNTDELDSKGIGGDWTALALHESGNDEFTEQYIKNVSEYVSENGGVLHSTRYTEYSRTVYVLATLGADTRNVGGYDLAAKLFDYDAVTKQGVNGTAWALMALDAALIDDGEIGELRERYINNILASQNEDGSIGAISHSEVDLTAMCLRALGKYYETRGDVGEACDRAIQYIASRQGESGGFPSPYGEASETVAQVMLALDALGLSQSDARFEYSLYDALLEYQNSDGGFCHLKGGESDRLATEQAAMALAVCETGERK